MSSIPLFPDDRGECSGHSSAHGTGAEPRSEPVTAEARLVVACTKVQVAGADEVAIRMLLAGGIDWKVFARMLVERGLASRAGHTLLRVAPELLPDDISGALRAVVDQTRAANGSLLAQLAHTIEAMPSPAVEGVRQAHA